MSAVSKSPIAEKSPAFRRWPNIDGLDSRTPGRLSGGSRSIAVHGLISLNSRTGLLGVACILTGFLLAGCQSGKAPAPHVIPLELPPPVVPVVTNAPVAPKPVPVQTNAMPAIPTAPVFTESWVPLEKWCNAVGAPKPQLIHENASRTYTLPTAGGPAVLTAGNRVMNWGGVEFWLGYAPRITNSLLCVHNTDAQKTILPLVFLNGHNHSTNRTVTIDPGHGGRSVGTQSISTGIYEKDYTLDWAKRIQALLATNGWKAVLTRTNDTDVAITNRAIIADQAQASLFISLHFNSALDNNGRRGMETYCLTPTGMPSNFLRGNEDDQQAVFPNNAHDFRNFQYALKLHRSLVRATGFPDGGMRRARFMAVLRGQNRPAVLIEGGYLSNPQEARLIADPHFRQKLAEAVARVLCE